VEAESGREGGKDEEIKWYIGRKKVEGAGRTRREERKVGGRD
jgi:hypothetical protein